MSESEPWMTTHKPSRASFEGLFKEEAKIEPLKIVLQLEKNTEFGDSPIRFDITGYSFEMERLRQGENKNYELVTDGIVTGQIIVHHTTKLHRNTRSRKQNRRYD